MSPNHALRCHLARLSCRIVSYNSVSLFICETSVFGKLCVNSLPDCQYILDCGLHATRQMWMYDNCIRQGQAHLSFLMWHPNPSTFNFSLLCIIMNSKLPPPTSSPSCTTNPEYLCLESTSTATLVNAYLSSLAFIKHTELFPVNYWRHLLSHHPLVSELLPSLTALNSCFKPSTQHIFRMRVLSSDCDDSFCYSTYGSNFSRCLNPLG